MIGEDMLVYIQNMKEIIINAINLDLFMIYHNGNLVSLFEPTIIPEIDIQK